MKKVFFIFLILVLLAILTPFVLLGQVPVLSALVGAGQKDLGINVTVEESAAAQAKDGTQIVALPPGSTASEDFRLEGKREVDFTFDSQELSAHSNNRAWKNYPVKNVQIRINPDGSIESSAILMVSKFMPYAMGLGYSESQIREAMDKYKIPPVEVPVYIKGMGSVINDQVNVDAQKVRLGAVEIPGNIVSLANTEAEVVLEDIISKNSHSFHAESVTFSDGNMHFVGQLPEKEYVIAE